MIFGYVRVSTAHQNPERQIDAIKEAFPEAAIHTETWSGTSLDRPVWRKLRRTVKPGDCIVFDEVSRLARNAEEGFREYKDLFSSGVELRFLRSAACDTVHFKAAMENSLPKSGDEIADTLIEAVERVLFLLAERQIKAEFEAAQTEIDHLHKRTRDGMAKAEAGAKIAAARTGKTYQTQKERECIEVIRKHSKRFGGSLNAEDCMKLAGCSKNSYFKYCKAIEAEQNDSE